MTRILGTVMSKEGTDVTYLQNTNYGKIISVIEGYVKKSCAVQLICNVQVSPDDMFVFLFAIWHLYFKNC
jgi:hypothetical protein